VGWYVLWLVSFVWLLSLAGLVCFGSCDPLVCCFVDLLVGLLVVCLISFGLCDWLVGSFGLIWFL